MPMHTQARIKAAALGARKGMSLAHAKSVGAGARKSMLVWTPKLSPRLPPQEPGRAYVVSGHT